MRPLEHLSRKQREQTPRLFADYLLGQVRHLFKSAMVAALWVREDTIYRSMPNVDCWPRSRNAWLYEGPYPIIAHPPCGPFGNYWYKSKESISDGIKAMELVHRWGGVVEQPLGSRLYAAHGKGGWIEKVDQCDFGHQARKRTLLYWHPPASA